MELAEYLEGSMQENRVLWLRDVLHTAVRETGHSVRALKDVGLPPYPLQHTCTPPHHSHSHMPTHTQFHPHTTHTITPSHPHTPGEVEAHSLIDILGNKLHNKLHPLDLHEQVTGLRLSTVLQAVDADVPHQ